MDTDTLANRVERAAARRRSPAPESDATSLHFALARTGDARIALPLEHLVELIAVQEVSVSPLPHLPPPFAGLVRRHGRLLPVVDMTLRLTGVPASAGITGRLVVCRHSEGEVGVMVDEVTAVATVPRSSVREFASSAWNSADEFVSSVVYLDDHDHLLLDLSRLWQTLRTAVPSRRGSSCLK